MAKRFTEECNKKIKKINKKNKKVWLIILIILFIMLMFGIINLARNKWDMQKTVSGMISSVTGEEVDTIYALILGISEDIDTELTDTIILVSYNPYTQKAYMLSIPRDTYIGKSETKVSMYDKINAVYSKYGVDKTIEYVEDSYGMELVRDTIAYGSSLVNMMA